MDFEVRSFLGSIRTITAERSGGGDETP